MKTHVAYASMEIASCENTRLSRLNGDYTCIYLTVLIFINTFIIHFNLLNHYLSARLCLQMGGYPSVCLSSTLFNVFQPLLPKYLADGL